MEIIFETNSHTSTNSAFSVLPHPIDTEHSRGAGRMHMSSSLRSLQKELDSGLDVCTGGEGVIGSPIS
ncbi:hypothetical protein E2C01_008782 [Portunus trituberculatus]|uniref:Uncharacterized protein n=1 Tax=Portunus trituberculatus TaxID=210409 RepID=A0A5B7D3V0_PORTR|nr:hypothetical protein [Portunus trituberculatus]